MSRLAQGGKRAFIILPPKASPFHFATLLSTRGERGPREGLVIKVTLEDGWVVCSCAASSWPRVADGMAAVIGPPAGQAFPAVGQTWLAPLNQKHPSAASAASSWLDDSAISLLPHLTGPSGVRLTGLLLLFSAGVALSHLVSGQLLVSTLRCRPFAAPGAAHLQSEHQQPLGVAARPTSTVQRKLPSLRIMRCGQGPCFKPSSPVLDGSLSAAVSEACLATPLCCVDCRQAGPRARPAQRSHSYRRPCVRCPAPRRARLRPSDLESSRILARVQLPADRLHLLTGHLPSRVSPHTGLEGRGFETSGGMYRLSQQGLVLYVPLGINMFPPELILPRSSRSLMATSGFPFPWTNIKVRILGMRRPHLRNLTASTEYCGIAPNSSGCRSLHRSNFLSCPRYIYISHARRPRTYIFTLFLAKNRNLVSLVLSASSYLHLARSIRK